jgi:tRNA(His) 5'-end guanylyltransferase
MENREIFANITTTSPIFIRLDGRAFHGLTHDLGLEKPFDELFHKAMVAASTSLVAGSGFSPSFAYTFSDEISIYLTKLPFGGRVEKIDSVSAAYAASALTIALGCISPIAFDARVIPATPAFAVEYMINRQAEAWRNHINAYCQQALIEDGMSAREAAASLKGKPAKDLHEMMHERGLNLATTPIWQRRGALIYKRLTEKEGFNPVTGETVTVERSAVMAHDDLPLFSSPEGRAFIQRLIAAE